VLLFEVLIVPKYLRFLLIALLCYTAGCSKGGSAQQALSGQKQTLTEARQGHKPQPQNRGLPKQPFDQPPANIFRLVKYTSPVGELGAYVTPDPGDGKKHPIILWITGGDCNSIDVWTAQPIENDQSASAYRKAGILMMFPSLRGGNTNPGQREGYFGEVQDVLAAAEYAAKLPYVDPQRIYLGGHSTGGTLSLLVAECSDRFRAIFSFGPVDEVEGYEPQYLPFNYKDTMELNLRSPLYWMHCVKTPTFVIEGNGRTGNQASLQQMSRVNKNSKLNFILASGYDHFTVLAQVNGVLADKVLKDTGASCNITLTQAEALAGKSR
jgi:dipeptidyl aminopeptidase/acylaminoacyl peptidase